MQGLKETAPAPEAAGNEGIGQQQQRYTERFAFPYLVRKEIELVSLVGSCFSRIRIVPGKLARFDANGNPATPFKATMLFRELVNVANQSTGWERILPWPIRRSPGDKPGDKFVTAGTAVSIGFTPIGFEPWELMSMRERVIACAGLADGYRIHQCTGEPVACAVGENNLPRIVRSLRMMNPSVVVAVDNDCAGRDAGQASGCKWTCPEGVKDWSDLFQEHGKDAVREAIKEVA